MYFTFVFTGDFLLAAHTFFALAKYVATERQITLLLSPRTHQSSLVFSSSRRSSNIWITKNVLCYWTSVGKSRNVCQYNCQDNTPAHNVLSVKRFLAKNLTPILQHPPYSLDLAPCDFWLFPKLKSALKGIHFESVEAVKIKSTEVLKAMQEKYFQ